VAASFYFVPHVDHRKEVYDFPEPWKAVNWGIAGEGLPDPGRVRWILVDRQLFSPFDRTLVDRLLATEFTVRYEKDGIVLAERTHPGGRLAVR
jgi:hypothetical protein